MQLMIRLAVPGARTFARSLIPATIRPLIPRTGQSLPKWARLALRGRKVSRGPLEHRDYKARPAQPGVKVRPAQPDRLGLRRSARMRTTKQPSEAILYFW